MSDLSASPSGESTACTVCGSPVPPVPGAQCARCLLNLGSDSVLDDEDSEEVMTGRVLGDFELRGHLARGGMGVVYRAWQRSLQREVALKLMLGGELSGAAARRMFQTEALAAAALHHPHIVAVYDTGEHDLQPFIAMRLVPGRRNIAQWAAAHREAGAWRLVAEKAALVARAVAHAHDRGVLHRDLKPSNILWDDEAGPQVTDFGLAKIMNSAGDQVTLTAQMLGSPGYMAPEQTGETSDEITTATDVYGLGAVLYELLSGKPPFTAKSALETIRLVREGTPPALKQAPRDLTTVCFKCLARSPQDRYPSAAAVAEELERFSRGEPVMAVPLALLPKLWRWAKRKPAVAALSALTFLATVAGVTGILWQWQKAEAARKHQAEALEETRTANIAQADAIADLRWQELDHMLDRGEVAKALARAALFIRGNPDDWRAVSFGLSIAARYSFPVLTAPLVEPPPGNGVAARMSPDGKWFVHAGADFRVRVYEAATGREAAVIPNPPVTGGEAGNRSRRSIVSLAAGACSRGLAVAYEGGVVTQRSIPDGPPVTLPGTSGTTILWGLDFSADGTRLLGRSKNSIRVWETAFPEKEPLNRTLEGGITGAVISQDGAKVLGWNSQRAAVWDTASGVTLLEMLARAEWIHGTLSADGRRAALDQAGSLVRLWDLTTLRELPPCRAMATLIALNTDGTRLLAGGHTIPLAVLDTASSLRVSGMMTTHKVPAAPGAIVRSWITASPDGSMFATLGLEDTVRLWHADDGRPVCSPLRLGQSAISPQLQFSADSRRIFTEWPASWSDAGSHMQLGLWRLTTEQVTERRNTAAIITFSALSPDGSLCIAGEAVNEKQRRRRIFVRDMAAEREVLSRPCADEVSLAALTRDNQRLFFNQAPPGNTAKITACHAETGADLWESPAMDGKCTALALSPDESLLAALVFRPEQEECRLIIFRTEDGKELQSLTLNGAPGSLRFAPDGSGRVFVTTSEGVARIYHAASGREIMPFSSGTNFLTTSAWSPDARLIAAANALEVRVWDTETGALTATLPHPAWVGHLEFRPDGKVLVTVCRDGSIRLWDPHTRRLLSPPRQQGISCETVRFTEDGAMFLVRDTTGFRFWDSVYGEPVTIHYDASDGGVGSSECASVHAILSPDGKRVLDGTGSSSLTLSIFKRPPGRAPSWVPELLEILALQRETANGTCLPVSGNEVFRIREQIAALPPSADPFLDWAQEVLQLEPVTK